MATRFMDNPQIVPEPRPEVHSGPPREALLGLLRLLDAEGYDFVTATPSTHRRVMARPELRAARSLRDVLGWSLPVAPGLIDPPIERALTGA
jgi:hypothetical protein